MDALRPQHASRNLLHANRETGKPHCRGFDRDRNKPALREKVHIKFENCLRPILVRLFFSLLRDKPFSIDSMDSLPLLKSRGNKGLSPSLVLQADQ